jgi:hypothetical protein
MAEHQKWTIAVLSAQVPAQPQSQLTHHALAGEPFPQDRRHEAQHGDAAIQQFHKSQSLGVPGTGSGESFAEFFDRFVTELVLLHAGSLWPGRGEWRLLPPGSLPDPTPELSLEPEDWRRIRDALRYTARDLHHRSFAVHGSRRELLWQEMDHTLALADRLELLASAPD